MAKLYPPIIDGAIPAFTKSGGITIPYCLNRAVGINEIKGFTLILKSTITNTTLITRETSSVNLDSVFFPIGNTEEKLTEGGFYKVQIAFINNNNEVGYFSNVGIAKCIYSPTISAEVKKEKTDTIVGTYECKDITEKMYSYQFDLYSNGELIESSGEQLHNSTADVGLKQIDSWTPVVGMDNGKNYELNFTVTTINGYKQTISTIITARKDKQGYVPKGIQLIAAAVNENGYVNLKIASGIQNDSRELIYGTFQIFKTSSKDNFQQKTKVAYFKLENQDLFEKSFKDLTVESGYTYKYVLQQVNDHGIYSEEIYSNPVDVYYEHMFLFDGSRQLKIKFNPKVSTFKDTILETKVDTIGGKYPYFFRNPIVKYKELNISGLLSYQLDEENLFMSDMDIWHVLNKGNFSDSELIVNKTDVWTHNLTDENISAERAFKLYALNWLNNGEIKLFKSPTEGNYLVRLMNVSLAPNDTVGRMLHTFTASAYEVENNSNYSFNQALEIDRTGKYVGYRTIPLYDFPQKKIVSKIGENTYGTVNNNTVYEVIGNSALEYVVAATFEDVKPWTKFKVTLERGLEVKTITITIGATGFYAIPKDLGYHIRSIKLVESDWITGDSNADIINNRGQVTYEFERQAKHNNFNDITAIDAGIAVGYPWYPTWYKVKIKDPVTDAEGKQLYKYDNIGSADGYMEVAYFEDCDYPMINGIDYTEEIDENGNKTYKTLEDKPSILTLSEENVGMFYQTGALLYSFEPAKELTYKGESVGNQVTEYNPKDFKWESQQQEIKLEDTGPIYYYQCGVPKKLNVEGYYYLFSETIDNGFEEDKRKKITLDFQTNSYYQKLSSSGSIKLFKPVVNSNGYHVSSGVVKKENGEYANPFYVKLETPKEGKDSGGNVKFYTQNLLKINEYKLNVLTTSDLNFSSSKILDGGSDTIYKNFIPDIYYKETNVNGENYLKEEKQQIYSLDFELIQVFYSQDLIKDKLNFKCSGQVEYKHTYEDDGYQRTTRMISAVDGIEDEDKDFFGSSYAITDTDSFADSIWIDYDAFEGLVYMNLETALADYSEKISSLYNYNGSSNGLKQWLIDNEKTFTRESASDYANSYYYQRYYGGNNTTSTLYLNLQEQQTQNYTELTTPKDNEIIVVYENYYAKPVKIDLTNRFSYSLKAYDDDQGFNNIEAIYLGKNVRGYATYKRKRYSYKAALRDGVIMNLSPTKESE